MAVEPRDYWERRLGERYALDGVGVVRLGPGYNRWAYRVRRAAFRRAVRPLLAARPPRRVLDAGSGTGFYVELWRRLGAGEIVATDLTETAVAGLRRRHPGTRVARLDLGADWATEPSGLEPASFDYVSAMDVLFHVLDTDRYRRAFRNLADLLRPGGYLVFSEDMVRPRRHRRGVRRIKATRTAPETRRAWREAGLELVSRRPLFVLMNYPTDARSPALGRWWRLLRAAIEGRPRLGAAVGAALYPVERALVARARSSPSTELVVCRRPDVGAP